MKKFFVIIALMFATVFAPNVLSPVNTYAAPDTPNATCNKSFLGMRAWYYDLAYGSDCEIRINPDPEGKVDGSMMATFVTAIILNIIVDIASFVGYGMIAMVMWGGYLYMFSRGEPGRIEKGKKTLISATVGLAICLLANVLISFIVTIITGA